MVYLFHLSRINPNPIHDTNTVNITQTNLDLSDKHLILSGGTLNITTSTCYLSSANITFDSCTLTRSGNDVEYCIDFYGACNLFFKSGAGIDDSATESSDMIINYGTLTVSGYDSYHINCSTYDVFANYGTLILNLPKNRTGSLGTYEYFGAK